MSNLFSDDFIDALSVVGFIIGVMNYNENLSQSDKDDLLKHTSDQMEKLLGHIDSVVDEQNEMLRDIIKRLEDLERK